MRTILIWFLAALMALPVSAAQLSPRETATQTADGASVALVLVTGEKVKGKLFGVTPDGVTIVIGRDSLRSRAIPFAEIKSFKQRPAVLKNILAGLGTAWLVLMGIVMVVLADQ